MNRKTRWGIIAAGLWLTAAAYAQETAPAPEKKSDAPPARELKTPAQKLGYTMGVQFAFQLKSDGIEVNPQILGRALRTVLEGGAPAITRDETEALIQSMAEVIKVKMVRAASENLAASKKFFEENGRAEGVRTLPSGLQYKVIEQGEGAAPTRDDMVKIHFRGTLLSGQEFDSSFRRGEPDLVPVRDMIMGWQEAMPMMKEGGKWVLFVPPDLGFGEIGNRLSLIPPNAALIYEVELIQVVK